MCPLGQPFRARFFLDVPLTQNSRTSNFLAAELGPPPGHVFVLVEDETLTRNFLPLRPSDQSSFSTSFVRLHAVDLDCEWGLFRPFFIVARSARRS